MCWWRWGRVELPVQNHQPETYYERVRCFVVDRTAAIGSLPSGPVASPCGLGSGYVTLTGAHPRCMTLPQPTGMRLLPRSPYRLRRRGREQAGGCQLLRFAAGLTRPDGTSARILRGSGPVETTHPQTASGHRILLLRWNKPVLEPFSGPRRDRQRRPRDVRQLALHVAPASRSAMSRACRGAACPRDAQLDLGPAAVVDVQARAGTRSGPWPWCVPSSWSIWTRCSSSLRSRRGSWL